MRSLQQSGMNGVGRASVFLHRPSRGNHMGPRDKEGICVAFPRDVARCSLTAAKRVLVVVAVAVFFTAGDVVVGPPTREGTPSCIPRPIECYVLFGGNGCAHRHKTISK